MSSAEIRLPSAAPREAAVMHPCEYIQRTSFQRDEAQRLHHIRTTHGRGAAMDVALTETTLLGTRRIGSLPSSHTLYHAYRGDFTELGPEDVYGRPENNPNVQPASRAVAEQQVYGCELTMKSLGM